MGPRGQEARNRLSRTQSSYCSLSAKHLSVLPHMFKFSAENNTHLLSYRTVLPSKVHNGSQKAKTTVLEECCSFRGLLGDMSCIASSGCSRLPTFLGSWPPSSNPIALTSSSGSASPAPSCRFKAAHDDTGPAATIRLTNPSHGRYSHVCQVHFAVEGDSPRFQGAGCGHFWVGRGIILPARHSTLTVLLGDAIFCHYLHLADLWGRSVTCSGSHRC